MMKNDNGDALMNNDKMTSDKDNNIKRLKLFSNFNILIIINIL